MVTVEVGVKFRHEIEYGDGKYDDEDESEPAVGNDDYETFRSTHLRGFRRRTKHVFHGGTIILENEGGLQVKGRGCLDDCGGCCAKI